MSAFFRRITALCLCLTLLIASAAADTSASDAYSYTLRFTMYPDAYPEQDRPLITGMADMLNMLTVSGVYQTDGDGFDNNMTLQLGGHEETATDLRVYGFDDRWWIESNLLGDELLLVNNVALLEFGMKIYLHLNMPLQYPFLLINPYVHTSAFEWVMPMWEETFDGSGSRTIGVDALYDLALFISENNENERAFMYWIDAVTREIGIDYDVLDALYFLPDWVDGVFSPDGIVITHDGDTETWTNGGDTLFTRITDDVNEFWQLTLPMSDSGHVAEAFFNRTATDLSFNLTVTANDPGDTLSIALTASCPAGSFLSPGNSTLQLDATGSLLPSPITLRVSAVTDGSSFVITQSDAETGMPMLTLTGTIAETTADEAGIWTTRDTVDGVNILSISDQTLSTFIGSIIHPLVEGAWPLLVHLPASTFASIYDFLDQYGVLEIIISSLQ